MEIFRGCGGAVEKVWGRGVSKKRMRSKNRNQSQRISWKKAVINLL